MNKRTLAAILAVGIAGGAVAASRLDSVKNFDLSSRIMNAASISTGTREVQLGQTVGKTKLEAALSSAANELGYSIGFDDVYRKGYQLGSVRETSNYHYTGISITKGGLPRGLEISFYSPDVNNSFYIRPTGLVSDQEIKQYLNVVSKHLSE